MSKKVAPEPDEARIAIENSESLENAAYFSFMDVWASVPKGKMQENVLEGVSGYCKPGESLIIMGPSGAGKSTLLDTLGFRKTLGKFGGDIRINGSKCTRQQFIRQSGYVTSDDVEVANLTVEETINFAAALRLPSNMPSSERAKRAAAVLEDMHLTSRAKSKVGSITVRGVSTGERKRLSIAIELLPATSVLFLDEPTTGLDSNTGREVITRILEASKKRHLATVMTIHQPSYQILQQFDRLLLLAKGKVAYFGPTLDACQYFENLGVQIIGNPAEIYAEILACRADEMAAAYRDSDLCKENLRKIESIHSQLGSVNLFITATQNRKGPLLGALGFWQEAPWYKQLACLAMRDWRIYSRDPLMSLSRYIAAICTALFFGFAFFKLGDGFNAYGAKGALCFAVAMFPALYTAAAIPHWLQTRKLYYLQVSSGFYHPFFWIITAFVIECLFCGSMMAILVAILFPLAGFNTANLGLNVLLVVLCTWGSVGFCLLTAMVSSSIPYAMTGFNCLFFLNTIYGGFFVLDVQWQNYSPFSNTVLKWLSVQRGWYKGATRAEMYEQPLNCLASEMLPYPLGNLTQSAMTYGTAELQKTFIATNTSLVKLNTTNPAAFQHEMAVVTAAALHLGNAVLLGNNIGRLMKLGNIAAPSTAYTTLLTTLSTDFQATIIGGLNISNYSTVPAVVGAIISSYETAFVGANTVTFQLPNNYSVCPFVNGTAYMTGMMGFTGNDTYVITPDSLYEGYMGLHAVICLILAYIALLFCKVKT
ncbi:ATP-binding cassette sub- G member 3 [Irineochytrium annulatum]|nr:ATP-binding cassette sub- G member 3 [Irineochytrium annulatum]